MPSAVATSATSISRSYNIVKISRCRGDSNASGSLSRRTGSTGSTASRLSGTASIGTTTGRCRRSASRAVLRDDRYPGRQLRPRGVVGAQQAKIIAAQAQKHLLDEIFDLRGLARDPADGRDHEAGIAPYKCL